MHSISPELWEAYRRTEYRIGAPYNLVLKVDQNTAGLPGGPWAYLTAWNPGSKPLPRLENRNRQFELESLLCDERVTTVPGTARDPAEEWPDEEGVLVLGLSRERAVELGRTFGQNAVLIGVGEGPVQLVECPASQK